MDYVHMCTDSKLVPAIDAKVSWCSNAAMCGYDYLCDAARHVCYPPRDCLAAVEVWRGGLAYYGGFIFAVLFAMALEDRTGQCPVLPERGSRCRCSLESWNEAPPPRPDPALARP